MLQNGLSRFGGPQGMLLIEEILDRSALRTGLAPESLGQELYHRAARRTPRFGRRWDHRNLRIWQGLLIDRIRFTRDAFDRMEYLTSKPVNAGSPYADNSEFRTTHQPSPGLSLALSRWHHRRVIRRNGKWASAAHKSSSRGRAESDSRPIRARHSHATDKVPNTLPRRLRAERSKRGL